MKKSTFVMARRFINGKKETEINGRGGKRSRHVRLRKGENKKSQSVEGDRGPSSNGKDKA